MEQPLILCTPAVLRVCDALENALEGFLAEKAQFTLGMYEADQEATLVFNLCIRQIEALLTLARQDLVFLPAAYQLARAAFECSVRAAWMVDRDEPLEREARWVAHLDGEISALRRYSERVEAAGGEARGKRLRASQLSDFRGKVAAALQERGVSLLKQMPKVEHMLASIGGKELYRLYIESSQYVHGGHAATWLYRSGGVGSAKVIGEIIDPVQWIMPLRMSWLALEGPGTILIARLLGGQKSDWIEPYRSSVAAAFSDLVKRQSHSVH